ncbi:hypothetical protein QJS10_CPB12g01706 [Acorus calamus]|uniref:Uncharacterized protein n=1 Tax=Acorus calamus TaxID=4465 RepID=A0AAV9DKB0_ACOCL|nr:hypothetical protein QJS10_CPB12g01706 [Acorus calamus]
MDDCGGSKRAEFLTVGDACRRSFACEEGRSSSFDAGPAAMSYEDLKQQDFKPISSSGMNGQLLHKAEPPPNQHFMAVHQMTRLWLLSLVRYDYVCQFNFST